MQNKKMKRALSPATMALKRFRTFVTEGDWQVLGEQIVLSGSWIIWANSFNGKTSFCLDLAKYLTKFDKVLYNSMEEGDGYTMQQAMKRAGISLGYKRFQLICEDMEEFSVRLRKHKSAKIVFIDSFQYTGWTKSEYRKFKNEFGKKKLLIWISHAEGKLPEGRPAKYLRYDSDVKIFVEGYVAFVQSRLGGSGQITIWEEGAAKYWGQGERKV